jgi:hypothetical protein
MELNASGHNLSFTGQPFDQAEMNLSYSNNLLQILPLKMSRPNQTLDADVTLYLDEAIAQIDGTSQVPLPELAQMIAPDNPTVLQHFSFPSNTIGVLHGRVDYASGTNHQFSGWLRANSVSAAGLTAKDFSTTFKATGTTLALTNTIFKLMGGAVESSSSYELNSQTPEAPYCMNLDVTQVDFQQLLNTLFSQETARSSGRLSGTFDFCSDASADFWDNTIGGGEVEITGGKLQDLPLLGGFSRIIRTTLPGFSVFSFTTLYSEYEFRDGALHTDDLQLGGSLLSARGHGAYSPAKGLDFNVTAEPLRRTRQNKTWYMVHLWLADALKQGTAPLFRLLEMKLEGSLKEPKWRLNALPK